ncbi:MFS transporter [Ileibacterium valens]|uniref:MFS transporter n=1 Tax=Ileibacterium valens TaxID=1862668 RepID=UPI00259B8816|nr:MFS transporter [Ileibacterium valens]
MNLFHKDLSQTQRENPNRGVRFRRMQVLVNCILMSGVVLGLCFYTSGMFYDSVSSGLGLTSSEISLTTTFYLIALAVGTLIVPKLMSKISYHLLFQAGAVIAVFSTLMMSFCFGKEFLYILCIVQGLGCSLIGLVPVMRILGNWFIKNNTWFTALVLAFPALVAAVSGPLFSGVISALSWRMSYVLLAVFITAFLIWGFMDPISVTPEAVGCTPLGKKEPEVEAVNNQKSAGTSLMVLIAIAACGACLIALPLHFGGFATSIGLDLIVAGRMLSWAMIGNIVFKLAGGWIAQRFGIYKTTAGLALAAIISTAGLALAVYNHNLAAIYFLSFVFGSAYALSELSLPLLIRSRFGRFRYTTIYSFVHACSLTVTGLAIYFVGLMVDASGTYLWVWLIACLLAVLIEVLLFWATGGTRPLDQQTDVPFSKIDDRFIKEDKINSMPVKNAEQTENMTSSVDEANQPEGPSEYESPSFYYEKKQEEARKAAEDSQIDQDVLPEMTKSFNTSAKSIDEQSPYTFSINTDKEANSASLSTPQSENKTVLPEKQPEENPGIKISVSDTRLDKPLPDFSTNKTSVKRPVGPASKPDFSTEKSDEKN